MKITITHDDGSLQDFFPQAYTDEAVAAAVAAVPVTSAPEVIKEVDVVNADGTEEKFTPAV